MQSIPQPPTTWLVGNLKEIDDDIPQQSIIKLAQEYGSIMKLDFVGKEAIYLSSHELIAEVFFYFYFYLFYCILF